MVWLDCGCTRRADPAVGMRAPLWRPERRGLAMPFPTRRQAQEAGRRGGLARAAARRAAREPLPPFSGTMLDMMDAAGLTGPSWEAWRVFWRAVFALPMDAADLDLFARHAGRSVVPPVPVKEAWLIVGRRGGKSRSAALAALYQAIRRNYAEALAPGETATVAVVAADRAQARSTLSYLKGLTRLPVFAPYVGRVLRDEVELRTGATVTVHTASYRTIRGYSLAGVICEEIAFWLSDESGANPDSEILAALRPGMATVPDALLLGLSSPYSAKGELFNAYQRFFGTDDPSGIAWNADSITMHPDLDPAVVQRAFEDDPMAAASEYGQGGSVAFRRDVESFLDAEAVRSVTVPERRELPPMASHRYFGFVDPSGGSQDAFTLAIAHREGQHAVLDLLREVRPPCSPDSVVVDLAATLRAYRVGEVKGDRYAGEWPRERFRIHGIRYAPSERTKSDLYRELLPLINAGRVELPDLPRLRAQLVGLERRTARGGRDSVDHAPGGHDDVANAAAGALVMVAESFGQGSGWSTGRFRV
jgi:hypothetical protein